MPLHVNSTDKDREITGFYIPVNRDSHTGEFPRHTASKYFVQGGEVHGLLDDLIVVLHHLLVHWLLERPALQVKAAS